MVSYNLCNFLTKIHKELNAKGLSVTTLMAGEKIHEKKCLNITSEKINLLGYLPTTEIVKLYRICDLFIFPSNFEIGPNVVLEAKACRAVCVVSPNGGGKRIEKSGNISGEFVRIYLGMKKGMSASQASSTVIADLALATFSLLLMAIFSLFFLIISDSKFSLFTNGNKFILFSPSSFINWLDRIIPLW